MAYQSPGKTTQAHIFAIACIIGLFFVHAFIRFLSAGRDDTFIMLWAGQTFSLARGFVNYNYKPEEIASSEIAAWLASPTSGWDPGHALLYIKTLGLLTAALTLVLIWAHRGDLKTSRSSPPLIYLPIIATAASQSFQYWSLGGLETPYHTFLLTAFAFSLSSCLKEGQDCGFGNTVSLVAILSLLMMTRTEAFWPWLLIVGFILIDANGISRSRSAYVIAIAPGFVFVLILATRYYYTGGLWPNPVYAKVGLDLDTLEAGIAYIANYLNASPWCKIQTAGFLYGLLSFLIFLFRRLLGKQDIPGLQTVLGSIVAGQMTFVVLSGGNWMEYSRFIAPITPELNILLLLSILELCNRLQATPRAIAATSVILLSTSLAQLGTWKNPEIKNCARPLTMDKPYSLTTISEHTIAGNCAHGRDIANLKPFIDHELPRILQTDHSPLIVASYQAGFFPYFLRQRFAPNEVIFIDTVGLTDGVTARLPGKRTARGLTAGGRIDLALRGEAGALSEYLKAWPPSLIYVLDAGPEMRENLSFLGYQPILDKPGTVIFYKPGHGEI